MLPTKFQVYWPFNSGEEAKNRLSSVRAWRSSSISNQNDFTFLFNLQVTLMLPTKFKVPWHFCSEEEAKN